MHRLLRRQLRKVGSDASAVPDARQWAALLDLVSAAYDQADNDRYTLERSLQISSDEMQEMLQRQKTTSEGRLHALVNALPDQVFMLDEDGRYVEVIAGGSEGLSPPAGELRGCLMADIMPADRACLFLEAIRRALDGYALQLIEYEQPVASATRVFEGRVMPTGLRVNGLQTVVFVARDVTELAESRDKLRHVANHDALTGLPNRGLLEARLVQAVARARRHDRHGALIVLDLDRFKQINDSLGHPVGDRLLQEVAGRLQRACRREDTLVRFGGDEFIVILEDMDTPTQAGVVAQHLLEVFAEPISLAGFDLDVTASIGISVFPDNGGDADALLRQADSAMYAAKEAGRNQYSFYTEELGSNVMTYLALESSLRKAIAGDELLLLYQPQFRLSDQSLFGVEALVRWPTADPAHRSPAAFIPVAEMSGLIEPLGLWVLDEACRQAAHWHRIGFDFDHIAVNLSSRQLNNPRLAEQVVEILARHGVTGGDLEFEITESMVVQEGGVAHRNLEAFAGMGIGLAIDDFGTGHSSLVNLKRFPLSRLKIDRSFVDGLGDDPNDEAITAASIALARGLGLEVVAEGVETLQQAEFLRRQACEVVQGYFYARPMAAEEIERHFAVAPAVGRGL